MKRPETLKFFVELLLAGLHCMLPDVACTARSSFSHSQMAGDAFMFSCKNQFKVRRLSLARSHILPLGYSPAGVFCTTLVFINEIDQCVKLLCSPLRGCEGAHEATAGVLVHNHAHSFRMGSAEGELTRPHKGTLLICSTLKAGHPKARRR